VSLASTVTPVYTGFQPIASCHFQCIANLLEAQGLPDAGRKVCPSWGFSWPRPRPALWRGNRWIDVLNRLHGLAVERVDFGSWGEAQDFEADLLERGLPFVAEVDAYELPSEYEGREHVSHTIIVLRRDGECVVVLDAMNRPREAAYGADSYERMRTNACVEAHHLYYSPGGPARLATPVEIAAAFADDLDRHWAAGLAVVDDYLDWLEETGAAPDVARVGGERLYLGELFSLLGELDRRLAELSTAFGSLASRWFLAHSLAVQADGTGPSQARLRRLIGGLRDREAELAETVRAGLAATVGPAGARC
jgi:hypothetical protein